MSDMPPVSERVRALAYSTFALAPTIESARDAIVSNLTKEGKAYLVDLGLSQLQRDHKRRVLASIEARALCGEPCVGNNEITPEQSAALEQARARLCKKGEQMRPNNEILMRDVSMWHSLPLSSNSAVLMGDATKDDLLKEANYFNERGKKALKRGAFMQAIANKLTKGDRLRDKFDDEKLNALFRKCEETE